MGSFRSNLHLNNLIQAVVTGGLVPKGAYDNSTDYAVGDSVDYNGSSYVMFVDAAAGTLPTDDTKWQILASAGATGASIVSAEFVADDMVFTKDDANTVTIVDAKIDLTGPTGTAATVDAGTTTTGAPGSSASVVNSGTTSAAIFDFTIPEGDKGDTGTTGASIVSGAFVLDDLVFTKDDASNVVIDNAKNDLKGPTGATGATGEKGDKGDTGATGADGPNNITAGTTTTLTGFLKGNGAVVSEDSSTYLTTTNAASTYVELAGDTMTGTLGVPRVQFDIAATPATNAEGLLQWNATDGTLDLGMDGGDITQQIGQELFMKVRNVSAGTIPNGSPVYISGRTGNRPNIYLAKSDSETTSGVIGLTTQDITSPSDGFVTILGYVRQIKTDYSGAGNWGTTWTEGDNLYISKTVAGQLTNVEPTAPHHSDIIGTVAIVGGVGIGSILINKQTHKTLEELTDVDGGVFDTNGQTLVWDDDKSYFTKSDAFPTSKHYTGFPDRTSTSISFDDSTYTITLTATDDTIWINGVAYIIDTLTKQLSVAQEAVTGLYWFWITAPLGVPQLNVDISPPGFDKCLVATVYWNTTTNKGIISDERHWMGRDKWMHEYLHETVGARYANGMAGTFTNTTVSIEAGEFYDEDIEHDWTDPITTVRVMYHNGSDAWAWDILTTPYKVVNPGVDSNLRFNTGTTLSTATANRYVNQWVFATADVDYPIQIFIGTAQYTTLAAARAAQPPSLGGLGTAENKLIYHIIYQNTAGTPTYQEAIDYRTASSLPTGSYVATDHGTLAGLTDLDHPASAIINTPAGNIVATTVQAAIDELDTEKLDATLAGTTYLKLDASNDPMTGSLSFEGNAAKTLTVDRHTTADTAGNSLTVQAGGASSGATDKAGGALYLNSGISTGTGTSQILLRTYTPSTTGTTDNSIATRVTIDNTGLQGRLKKQTGTVASSATPTINTDTTDYYSITALAADITSFTTNLTGTPNIGDTLWISITGTATRAIAWGTSFEDSTVALPLTTVGTARLDILLGWNSVSQKWRCLDAS